MVVHVLHVHYLLWAILRAYSSMGGVAFNALRDYSWGLRLVTHGSVEYGGAVATLLGYRPGRH